MKQKAGRNMSYTTTLAQDINRINALINETNELIESPVSNLAKDMGGYLEQNSSKLAAATWNKFRTLTKQGRKEFVIVGGLVMGGLFVGAKAIDITRNAIAHTKARQKLNAYYQALSVKQNLLIEEQQKIILRLSNDIDLLEEEQEQIQKTISNMAKTITAIQEKTAAKKA